ncbi:hypothetical protein [Streptomyces djakartensis]|uniref:UL36 very large tegument protein n=1 Tax=Streptomyces djakartensis TaxID=68193 RepID=A0ABQ2ZF67_9ACTN|nr:hypothetical protein [Streptomyces djakartensis]GGY14927.1 hypothetical protein GCM10010384_20730 [Streptomyces djakartensis]
MAAEQLPSEVREFAQYLDGLLSRLDPSGGWCAVFWQRDPEGMRACLEGRELPPWDVVEALLQDLAGQYGPGGTGREPERARSLHASALAAYDAEPGARDALGDRLDVMLREQRYAADRRADLTRRLASATTREQADALRLDLAWAQDDHERATARCAELRARMADLDRRAGHAAGLPDGAAGRQAGGAGAPGGAGAWVWAGRSTEVGAGGAPAGVAVDAGDAGGTGMVGASGGAVGPEPESHTDDYPGGRTREATAPPRAVSEPPAAEIPAPKQRKRRRGGARFAGLIEEEAAPVVVPPAVVPTLPEPSPAQGRAPRGARFARAAAEEAVVERTDPSGAAAAGAADRTEVGRTVETLTRLRREGRSGEAHAVLVEAASCPPARFPLLADALERAGLGADWQTLLWEAASLPAGRLVAAADALSAAGRAGDGRQILRQGVARPPHEVGQAVLGLTAEGRRREVRALLDAYVRARTPQEAARSAEPDPQRLVPLLLEAAQGVSDERRWDLLHALRVAGFPA